MVSCGDVIPSPCDVEVTADTHGEVGNVEVTADTRGDAGNVEVTADTRGGAAYTVSVVFLKPEELVNVF